MIYFYLFFLMNFFTACSFPLNGSDTAKSQGDIKIESGKATYDESENIVITIWNNMDRPLTTMDQHTSCSIILIEQRKDSGWQEINNCTLNAPAKEISIPAKSHEKVELIPTQPFAANLPIGTYRATLIYTLGDRFKPRQSQRAFSEIFTVH